MTNLDQLSKYISDYYKSRNKLEDFKRLSDQIIDREYRKKLPPNMREREEKNNEKR